MSNLSSNTSDGRPRRAPRAAAVALALAACCAGPAFATEAGGDELVDLINAYRGEPRTCEGRRTEAAGPLASAAALAAVRTSKDAGSLREALKVQGYRAAKAQVIGLTGPAGAQQAMALLRQRYCGPLLSRDFAEIGVSHRDGAWQRRARAAAARPPTWATGARRAARSCGSPTRRGRSRGAAATAASTPRRRWPGRPRSRRRRSPTAATWRGTTTSPIAAATAAGSTGAPAAQATAGGRWARTSPPGQGSPGQAMAAWLSSPHHCENIMAPGFADMGAAYAIDADSQATIYWTQVFGTPRGGGRR